MFFETLENNADNEKISEILFPMLVGSKLDVNKDTFANIQLFSILTVEGAALNTGAVYLEVTGQIMDIPFHVKKVHGLNWVALTNYRSYMVADMITSYLHNLRLMLFIDVLKKLPFSKIVDTAAGRDFLTTIKAYYPGVELNEDSKNSLDQLSALLDKHNSDLREFEFLNTNARGELFNELNKVVSQAEGLFFENLAKGISATRLKEIHSSYHPF